MRSLLDKNGPSRDNPPPLHLYPPRVSPCMRSLRVIGPHPPCHLDLILSDVLLDLLATSPLQNQIYINGPDLLRPLENCLLLIRTCPTFSRYLRLKCLRCGAKYTHFVCPRFCEGRKNTQFLFACAMGLLDQLWDDTLAGPRPETGLGKLRKHSTFSHRSSSGKESDVGKDGYESPLDPTKVTRSIMIVKPPGYQSGSPPVSPAGTTPPVSPFSGSGKESFRFRRRSASDACEKRNEVGLRSPSTPYDV